MTDPESIKPVKRRLSLCSVSWLLVLTALLSFYVFKAIQFEGKVRTYSKNIEVGMGDLEILNLLGRYSRFERDFDGYHFVMVFEGKYFLRDDIILTFDPRSRRLVSKSRGRIYRIISVD